MTEEATPEVEDTAAPDSENEESATSEETEVTETEETEDTTDDPEKEGEDDPEKEKPKPKNKGFQKRINRLTREKRELESRLTALEQQRAPQPAAKEAPKRDDFESYEDYLEAKAEHVAESKVAERLEKQQQESAAKEAQTTQTELLDSWEDKKDDARERYVDFDDVMEGSDTPITPHMSQALLESDIGADIAYHLANNDDDVARISRLSPPRQMIEIGKLEAKISGEINKPKTKTPSKAPAPTKPTKGKSPSASDLPSDSDSMDEWARKERARVAKKFG